jgi:hypothetical protein
MKPSTVGKSTFPSTARDKAALRLTALLHQIRVTME